MSDWTPINTAMPEELEDVLVVYEFDDEPTIDMAFWRSGTGFILTGTDPEILVHPTHWMPLPKLPARENAWPCGHEKQEKR